MLVLPWFFVNDFDQNECIDDYVSIFVFAFKVPCKYFRIIPWLYSIFVQLQYYFCRCISFCILVPNVTCYCRGFAGEDTIRNNFDT